MGMEIEMDSEKSTERDENIDTNNTMVRGIVDLNSLRGRIRVKD